MPIFNDTTIKGDLNVSGVIIENGKKIDDKYAVEICLIDEKIVIKNASGEIISTVSI